MSDESPSPFSYAVSNDKKKLKIELNEAVVEYSADQVSRLAQFFSRLRETMLPEIPATSEGCIAIEAQHYDIYQKPEDGSAQIYLRVPGYAWTYIHLQRSDAVAVSEILNPQAPPDGTHKH